MEESVITKSVVVLMFQLTLALSATLAITAISGYPVIDVAFEAFQLLTLSECQPVLQAALVPAVISF